MAVTCQAGYSGPDVRSDVLVTVSDSSRASVHLESSVGSLYGDSILSLASCVLETFGAPQVDLRIEDSGALPYVLRARMEAALSRHTSKPVPAPMSQRQRKPIPDRLRRTRLYIPGNTPKFMINAGLFGADSVILDLEDSVAQDRKAEARLLVAHALAEVDFGASEVMVRVNSGGVGKEDLSMLAKAGVQCFLLPKVEAPEQIREADSLLENIGSDSLLLPLIESARGLEAAFKIASASPRIVAISLGLQDYLADIGATESSWADGRLVNAARAAEITPLASVFPAVDDHDGLEHYVAKAARIGYEGVGCIHPGQVPIVHKALMPTQEEIDHARKVVQQFELAETAAMNVDGQMVDLPVYRRAQTTLRRGGLLAD